MGQRDAANGREEQGGRQAGGASCYMVVEAVYVLKFKVRGYINLNSLQVLIFPYIVVLVGIGNKGRRFRHLQQ